MRKYRFIIVLALLVCIGVSRLNSADFPELQYVRTIVSDTTNTLFGSRIVPIGDQDGDGLTDLLIGSAMSRAYVFTSTNSWSAPLFRKDSTSFRSLSMCGDLNDDGYPDISMSRGPTDRRIEVYFGGALLDSIPDLRFGENADLALGTGRNSLDINQDGIPEYITTGGSGVTNVQLYNFGIEYDSIPDLVFGPVFDRFYGSFGESLLFGYYNADSLLDFAVNFRPDPMDSLHGELHFFFSSPTFDTIPDFVIRRPGTYSTGFDRFAMFSHSLGDVNGDGYDDIFTCPGNSFDTVSFLYYGGSVLDTIPDVIISERPYNGGYLGDINNDGYNDLITSKPVEFGNQSKVWIYFGGPTMDSFPDVTITESNLPGIIVSFGHGASGIGDVTGDGVDDFAISADMFTNEGVVFIFAGWDMGTNIEVINEPTLPTSFQLHQNYPNPFNPETVIEYSLPTKSIVNVEIHNVLGQKITTLVDEVQSAGSYRLRWDGRDQTGERVASGVYFYSLKIDGAVIESRKMVLVK